MVFSQSSSSSSSLLAVSGGGTDFGSASGFTSVSRTIPAGSGANREAIYHLKLGSSVSTLAVGLSGLTGDANLEIARDANGNRKLDPGEVIGRSAQSGLQPEQITLQNLSKGDYYIKVTPATTQSINYTLTTAVDYAGPSRGEARDLGDLRKSQRVSDTLGTSGTGFVDRADYYRFSVKDRRSVNVGVTGTNGDVNLQLQNASGQVIRQALNPGGSRVIKTTLNPGTYYVSVTTPNETGATSYQLDLSSDRSGSGKARGRDRDRGRNRSGPIPVFQPVIQPVIRPTKSSGLKNATKPVTTKPIATTPPPPLSTTTPKRPVVTGSSGFSSAGASSQNNSASLNLRTAAGTGSKSGSSTPSPLWSSSRSQSISTPTTTSVSTSVGSRPTETNRRKSLLP